ncbi:unnamed protein product [Diplocarpon coronariae]
MRKDVSRRVGVRRGEQRKQGGPLVPQDLDTLIEKYMRVLGWSYFVMMFSEVQDWEQNMWAADDYHVTGTSPNEERVSLYSTATQLHISPVTIFPQETGINKKHRSHFPETCRLQKHAASHRFQSKKDVKIVPSLLSFSRIPLSIDPVLAYQHREWAWLCYPHCPTRIYTLLDLPDTGISSKHCTRVSALAWESFSSSRAWKTFKG